MRSKKAPLTLRHGILISFSFVALVGLFVAYQALGQRATANTPAVVTISKTELGEGWPFSVREGQLECIGEDGVKQLTFTADGITYAVNGSSKRSPTYKNLTKIWLDDPNVPGTKRDISTIIDRGLALCK